MVKTWRNVWVPVFVPVWEPPVLWRWNIHGGRQMLQLKWYNFPPLSRRLSMRSFISRVASFHEPKIHSSAGTDTVTPATTSAPKSSNSVSGSYKYSWWLYSWPSLDGAPDSCAAFFLSFYLNRLRMTDFSIFEPLYFSVFIESTLTIMVRGKLLWDNSELASPMSVPGNTIFTQRWNSTDIFFWRVVESPSANSYLGTKAQSRHNDRKLSLNQIEPHRKFNSA